MEHQASLTVSSQCIIITNQLYFNGKSCQFLPNFAYSTWVTLSLDSYTFKFVRIISYYNPTTSSWVGDAISVFYILQRYVEEQESYVNKNVGSKPST